MCTPEYSPRIYGGMICYCMQAYKFLCIKLIISIPNNIKETKFLSTHFFRPPPHNYPRSGEFLPSHFFTSQTALTPSMSRMWPGLMTHIHTSYDNSRLAMMNMMPDYNTYWVTPYVSHIWLGLMSHDQCSYELKQLASRDDKKSDSYKKNITWLIPFCSCGWTTHHLQLSSCLNVTL